MVFLKRDIISYKYTGVVKRIFVNNTGARGRPSSNPGKRRPDDENKRFQPKQMIHAQEKARMASNFENNYTNIIFKRGIKERDARKELFLLEGIEGFEENSLRSRMTVIIQRSEEELKELYYDLGIKNELPKTWADFKEFVVGFCMNESLYTLKNMKKNPGVGISSV
jgi:hypothetical protein